VGAVLDFPELLHDPEVEQALTCLDGDLALTVAALRRMTERHTPRHPQDASAGPNADGHSASQGATEGSTSVMRPLQLGVYADEFLAQVPRPIHSFAVGRLASPAFETVDVARGVLLDNARKLSSLSLKRENAAEIEQLHRVEATGDADKENELLRAAIARAQNRHGLT
jgi:DNA primase